MAASSLLLSLPAPILIIMLLAMMILPLPAFVLIAVGGFVYSGGAVVYALKRPDPSPRYFGYHEIFHACTIVAAICHFIAIAMVTLG